jgi:hypothetical protein
LELKKGHTEIIIYQSRLATATDRFVLNFKNVSCQTKKVNGRGIEANSSRKGKHFSFKQL